MTPYQTQVLYNTRITMRDGIELSANLFMPIPKTEGEKFPVILEMIPYRKDDWRYVTDHQRMTYFAERGFACCRLDIRGTGSSQGIALDEYTAAVGRVPAIISEVGVRYRGRVAGVKRRSHRSEARRCGRHARQGLGRRDLTCEERTRLEGRLTRCLADSRPPRGASRGPAE